MIKIAAHITSYNDEKSVYELVHRLLSIKPELSKIYIVDNSSCSLEFKLPKVPQLKITYLDKNYGVGKAINLSINDAIQDGMDWLWVFDHDSLPFYNTLSELLIIFSLLDLSKVAVIAPAVININPAINEYVLNYGGNFTNNWVKHILPRKCDFLKNHIYADYVVSSGSLLNVALLKMKNLYYAEDMFLNALDFEFSYHIKKSGFKTVVVPTTYIYHAIGQPKVFLSKIIPGYNSLGYKTMARNYYIFSRYYLKSSMFFSFILVGKLLLLSLLESLKEDDYKFRRFFAVFEGILDINNLKNILSKNGRF